MTKNSNKQQQQQQVNKNSKSNCDIQFQSSDVGGGLSNSCVHYSKTTCGSVRIVLPLLLLFFVVVVVNKNLNSVSTAKNVFTKLETGATWVSPEFTKLHQIAH